MKITYDGGEQITELDNAIYKIMEDLGYKNWASGMDLTTGVRDLAFDKE